MSSNNKFLVLIFLSVFSTNIFAVKNILEVEADNPGLKKACWSGSDSCDWSDVIQKAVDDYNGAFIPAGNYRIDKTIRIQKSNVIIQGEGSASRLYGNDGVTMLEIKHEDYRSIYLGEGISNDGKYQQGILIDNIGMLANRNGLGGIAISVRGMSDSRISNCFFNGLHKFLDYDAMSTTMVTNIQQVDIRNESGSPNYIIYSAGINLNNDNTFDKIVGRAKRSNIYLDANYGPIGNGELYGAQDGVTIINSKLFHSGDYNIFLRKAFWSVISNNKLFEANLGNIACNSCQHLTIQGNVLAGTYETNKSGSGILIYNIAGYPQNGDIVIANNVVSKPPGHGIHISKTYGFSATGNLIKNPNYQVEDTGTPANTYHGVYIDMSIGGVVKNNLVYQDYKTLPQDKSWDCEIAISQSSGQLKFDSDASPCTR